MLTNRILNIAAAVGLLGVAAEAQAQDSAALIDALVKKGVLSDKEATEVRTQMQHDASQSSANKIKLSNSITELKLYGDLRLRYQYDNRDNQVDPPEVGASLPGNGNKDRSPTGQQRSRWRFRLRLNADFRLTEQFSGGVELQTGQASDSANQTFENGFTDYNIFISKAYLKWDPSPWLSVSAGKFNNPFYATELVWDPDINPTGIAESFSFQKMRFGSLGSTSAEGYSKDGKTVATAPAIAGESPWELTLVAGQFIFDDNLEGGGRDNATRDNDSTTDAYLFETQLIASYKFTDGVKFTIAPAWLTYVNGSVSDVVNENSFQDSATVSGATRNLNLLLLPGDVTFKLAGVKTKFYWDFAYNIEGRKRTEEIYALKTPRVRGPGARPDPDDFRRNHSNVDDYAYLVGLQFGENKKRGDLSMLANWRQTGIGSVDPNLNDSDFAQGELNTKGVKLSLAYNLTDFAVAGVTYMYAWNLRSDLAGGEATNGNAIADSNVVQVLQVDLSVKF